MDHHHIEDIGRNVLSIRDWVNTSTVAIKNVACDGSCRHRSATECAQVTHLVFPYRGAFIRHVGGVDSLGDANSLLIFNSGQDYQISHPVPGGDECLSLAVPPEILDEICESDLVADKDAGIFREQSRAVDAKAQALAAFLVHRLRSGTVERLEAEIIALTFARRVLDRNATRSPSTFGRTKLVERAKLALSSDLSRCWTLGDLAAEIGISRIYLAQIFSDVEAMPLYRYYLQLRLSRALVLLPQSGDLTRLALDLGFSSHSHFSHAFGQHYGMSPSKFRSEALDFRPVAEHIQVTPLATP